MNTSAANGEQRPAFLDAESCRAWLAGTPLTQPVQALAQLLRQLNLLNRADIEAGERLAILELLRKPLMQVQEEGARRFIGKPLPLVPPERAAFDAAQAVWHALLGGYVRCIESALAGNEALRDRLALLVQRGLATLAAAQFDIYRACCQPTPDHWRTLHQLFASAERAGHATTEVADAARQGKTSSSPLAVYAEVLLLHAASPHELPARHLVWAARWARRWSARIDILASPPEPGKSTPLCVDLNAKEAAAYVAATGDGARWLDTSSIRQSLKKRLSQLEKGVKPAELQLGEDCTQPACGQLLAQVYQRWCRGGIARRHERQTADGGCELICGTDAIHYYLSGRKPFRQPGYADDEALRREREELATFGRIADAHQANGFSQQHGYQIEEWRLLDESPAGLQAGREPDRSGARIGQGQLVAARPRGGQYFLLGGVRWAMVACDGRLVTGIRMMPGRPDPVAARDLEATTSKEPYRPAFLLPAVEALNSPATIVMPPGHFRAGRSLELIGGPHRRIVLTQLVDRGLDFDRATYQTA
ncbi:MAG: hypothetical protein IPP18_07555 [Rhodocyclaceae bacterium]|nr:hypothetical protein [Rhodocyclaceae bacterium]